MRTEDAEMDKAAKKLEDMNGLKEDPDALWSPAAASRFLDVSVSALAGWRREGGGPQYVKISSNRVAYQKRDLISWIEARKHQSTSAETVSSLTKSGGKAGPS